MTCIYHHFISFPSGCGGVLQLFLQLLVSALWFHGLFPSGRIVSTLHVMRLCNAVGSSLLGTQGLLGNVFFFRPSLVVTCWVMEVVLWRALVRVNVRFNDMD